MNEDLLKIENQLCFPLYASAREVVKKYTPLLAELNLTYTQYLVMMVLWEQKSINVKNLGEKLFLDSGTLTPLLKKLEANGFVTRKRSSEDERVLEVVITGEGEGLKEKAAEVPLKIASCLTLELDEIKTLYRLLYKILTPSNIGDGSVDGDTSAC